MNASVDTTISPAQAEVNTLVANGLTALDDFRKLNQEQIDYIVAKASIAALDKHGVLAMHAVEETGRGVFEDKATKNLFACENVVRRLRDLKTVGIISEDDVTGITEIADPVGVVCGIIPTTNPTSTTIFKALIALKTRNPIIFAFHPSAQQCSAHAAQIVRDAAIAAGAPANCATSPVRALRWGCPGRGPRPCGRPGPSTSSPHRPGCCPRWPHQSRARKDLG